METKSINFLNMVQTTQTCLINNKSLFKDIASLVRASVEMDEIVTGILAAQRQQASKKGLAEEKFTVRTDLAEAAHEIAALAHACATEHGHDAAAKRTDLSLSDVFAGTEAEFHDRCQGILDDTTELADDLGDCGATPAKLKNLEKLIGSFGTVKPKPRRGASVSKSATNRLVVLQRKASSLLRRRLDRLMVQFKKTQPAFYGEYQSARRIVNQAATHETEKSKAQAQAKAQAKLLKKPAISPADKSASSSADKSKVV